MKAIKYDGSKDSLKDCCKFLEDSGMASYAVKVRESLAFAICTGVNPHENELKTVPINGYIIHNSDESWDVMDEKDFMREFIDIEFICSA